MAHMLRRGVSITSCNNSCRLWWQLLSLQWLLVYEFTYSTSDNTFCWVFFDEQYMSDFSLYAFYCPFICWTCAISWLIPSIPSISPIRCSSSQTWGLKYIFPYNSQSFHCFNMSLQGSYKGFRIAQASLFPKHIYMATFTLLHSQHAILINYFFSTHLIKLLSPTWMNV